MYNRKGFSLVSFLLYLMLFTMITFFCCQIIVSLIVPSLTSRRRCQSIIALHIATDLFVRDVRAIQNNQCYWKLVTPHELVWQAGEIDIGWCFTDNRLERNTGIYDQGWKSKNSSIVARGIAYAVFTAEKVYNQIVGIELTLTPTIAQEKPIICYVAVRQGGKI